MLRTALEALEAADWEQDPPVKSASKSSHVRGAATPSTKGAKDSAAGSSSGVKPTLTSAKSRSQMSLATRGRPAAAGARSTRVVPEPAQKAPQPAAVAAASGPLQSGSTAVQDVAVAATGLQEGADHDVPHQEVAVTVASPQTAPAEEDLAVAQPWADVNDHDSDAPVGDKP
jgi:hypothetical protein